MSDNVKKKTQRLKIKEKASLVSLEQPGQASSSTRKKPCPRGTRHNKRTGLCEETISKPQPTASQRTVIHPTVSQSIVSQPTIRAIEIVNEPPPVINEQQTVINEPPPVINEQQTVINEQNNAPCLEDLKNLRTELKDKTKAVVEKNKECEKLLYGNFVHQYFGKIDDKNLTHRLLLKGLFNFYKTEKGKNKDFVLPFGVEHEDFNKRGFIQRFPRDNALPNTNFKRQHIFEALCRLLLLFNYDEGELGNNKTFYSSLERLLDGNATIQSQNDILDTKVNESSKGGIVDILFRTNISVDKQKQEKMSACEYTTINESNATELAPEESTILIQNKFFDVEKTNIEKYDVTRIHTLAGKIEKNQAVIKNSKIILMVNNQEALSSNLIKSKQQFTHIMPDKNIFGVAKIDKWFNKLLYDLYNSASFEDFLQRKNSMLGIKDNIKPAMEPRFHQLMITNSTLEYNKGGIQKFIWGAVPRSGKSFMIGDFISKRKESNNDIVIILGAKTETEPQFKKMFKDWANFSDYAVITPDGIDNAMGPRKIYIFSQEYFKSVGKIDIGVKIPKNVKKITSEMKRDIRKRTQFTGNVNANFPDLLRAGKQIDIFFDEIHKGGSTDNSETILYSFINAGLLIDFFIMVTATFAKPTEFYSDLDIGNNEIQLIEWSYSDQQFMKDVVNETKKQEMINSRINKVEQKIMEELFEDYRVRYGLSYLQVLSSEYTKYPELVLISPQLMNEDKKLFETNDVRNLFIGNLKCEACIPGQSIEQYQMPSNIFKQETPVTELLDYIGDKIYNSFVIDFSYKISSSHTQLWFLPDSDLYNEDCDACKNVNEERHEEEDEVYDEDVEEPEEDAEDEQEGFDREDAPLTTRANKNKAKKNKANIEPLTRGLAIKITKHERFTRYNVFIVHNTQLASLGARINETTLFGESFKGRIKMYNPNLAAANKRGDNVPLAEQIRLFEQKTYKEGKSLIILTGAKLRLGISLPCVDIGFNFDKIKSIDNNYQTMFRVLTEREKPIMKKYGYYVDFNMGRSIEFLYQYATVYGDKQNKKSTPEKIEYLQSLLFSFNFNGLNMTNKSTDISMYNDLKEKLALTNEKYVSYWSKDKNIASLIKKGLVTSDQNLLKELAQLLKITAAKKPINIQTVVRKGEKRQELEQIELQTKSPLYIENYKKGEVVGYNDENNTGEIDGYDNYKPKRYMKKKQMTGNDSEDGYNRGLLDGYNKRYDELYAEGLKRKEEEGTDEIYTDDLIEQLAQEIPTIVTLLSLFSTERGYECDSINDCLDNSIKQIEGFSELCRCGTVDKSNIVDCFINSPGNINGIGLAESSLDAVDEEGAEPLEGGGAEPLYDKGTLIKILRIIKQQIENSSLMNDALEIKFSTIIQKMKGTKDTLIKTMTPEEIDIFITNNLTIKKTEKDKFGEVFTPPLLITEMLGKIPPEVWTNPDLKWLDPANGIGNFPMLVYKKLMEKLKSKIPNDTERSNHILSKMLYMVEINPKNVKISRKIFGPNANIACADFLNEADKWKKEFKGVDKFDIILGNPPFQIEKGERRFGVGRTLWDKFIEKSIELLNVNGILGFINPSNWRGLGSLHKLWNLMTQKNQLLYLHIYGEKQGQLHFHVSQRFDLYIIKKTSPYKKTDIIDELGNKLTDDNAIDLQKWEFLPNYEFDNIKKIITTEENGIKVIYNSFYHTQNVEKGLLSLTYSKNKYKYCVANNINIKIECLYTNDKTKGHFGIPKVILSVGRYPYPHNDYEGNYGMTQGGFGIPIKSKKEGDDIVKAINTSEFKEIIKATKWGAFQIDYRMFKYFKPDFYKYFLKDGKTPSPKEPSPHAATKKKTPPGKPGPTLKLSKLKLRKVGGKKTKKQRHVKIPRKTRRKL